MFGKLKDKLKSALSIFSRKAEEEAEEKVVEIIKEEAPTVKPAEIKKKEAKAEEKKKEGSKKILEKKKKIAEKSVIKEKEKPEVVEKEKIDPSCVKITYFVHGTTTDNEKDLATGWNPGQLSSKGIQQSKELGNTIKHHHFDVVFCSDLQRAIDSAKLTFETRVPIREDARLRECNYGNWNGKEAQLFKSKLTEYVNTPFPNGESYVQVERRIAGFLNYLYENYKGKHIAIVAHQAPQLAMNVLLHGKTWEQAIQEDWRLRKAWQPGWIYIVQQPVATPKISPKETVLILHGWEDNAQSGFIPHLHDFLLQKNMEVLAFDQPHTAAPVFEEWFSFAQKKIADHPSASLSIVGHSMGGLLALKLAERYKLKKLILVAPVGSSPSEKYFKEIGKRLHLEELQVFRKYQTRSLDIKKIKSNVEEIAFVFGLKDEWITDEIRNFYVDSFRDVAEIHLFEEYGHMSESEGIKQLPILEELYSRHIIPDITGHKKAVEEKKGFFNKIKDTFRKKEEAPAVIIEENKVEEKPEKVSEKVSEKEEEQEKGLFGKIKQAITTKTISAEKFEELFWDLEVILLENNVSVEVIEKIKKDLQAELVDKPLPRDVESKILETLKKTLLEILSAETVDLITKMKHKKPLIIAFFGINGTGKTTSIAKLTQYFLLQHKSVVLAACDTFRAAAIQQLEEHATRLGVKMIKHDYGSDAAAVAFDAVKYAQKNNVDVVLIDTAGRLHSNTNLMAELEKIIRVAKPDVKIFVGESITGNDCIEQARQFNQLVEMDGAILTKADVDEKGGAPLSIAYTIKKPILFLGVGQRYEDLEPFDPQAIVQRLGL